MNLRRTTNVIFLTKTAIVLFALSCFFAISAHAANYYIRKGASGNGSSWSNAWNDLGSISGVGSGDTIYIAAGTYTGHYIANSSGWTLKRATSSDHGTSTGWSSSYDNTVTFDDAGGASATFTLSGYNSITIDGRDKSKFIFVGNKSGYPNWAILANSGYGIVVRNATIHDYRWAGIRFYETSGGCEVSGCEVYHNGSGNDESNQGAIVINNSSSGAHGYNTIANNYIHDPGVAPDSNNWYLDSIPTSGSSYIKIYGNVIAPGWEARNSADCISIRGGSNRYIYNNLFVHGSGNANQVIFLSASGGNITNTYIYNNFFYQKSGSSTTSPAVCVGWFGASASASGDSSTPSAVLNGLYFYNNTVYGKWAGVYLGKTNASGHIKSVAIKNNIFHCWQNSASIQIETDISGITADHNFYNYSSDGYVLTANGSKTLSQAQSALGWETHGAVGDPRFDSTTLVQGADNKWKSGFCLTASSTGLIGRADPQTQLFAKDYFGKTRGTSWDMGPAQFAQGSLAQTSAGPDVPTNLRIIQE